MLVSYTKPHLTPVNGGYELLNECEYVFHDGMSYTVPKGYVTNGADVPRAFWFLFPPNKADYMPAVIIHDWLCDVAGINNDDKDTYRQADEAFKDTLIACGLRKATISILYNAVKMYHKIKYKT